MILPVFAVKNGDSLAAVLAEKGEPASRVERGDIAMLTYGQMVIRLEKGVVVSIQGPGTDYAVRTQAPSTKRRTAGSTGVGQSGEWTTDAAAARAGAANSGRKTFLFFTGSDWCGWCQRLQAEVLGTAEFKEFARQHLVLVELDFPRRTRQGAELKAQNARLSQQYGIDGFPTIVVLDDTGKEIGRLGYQRGGPGPFLQQVRQL
jgi:protein disulfide-isomerase